MTKNKKYIGLSINDAYVEEIEKNNEKLTERLRLAGLLIDKITDKQYRQMISTYRLLTKDT